MDTAAGAMTEPTPVPPLPITILLIEDDAPIRAVVRDAVDDLADRWLEASTGVEGIASAAMPGVPSDVGGAGLGLAIASRLAGEQGGSIQYSERPGGGSVFALLLPAAELPEEQGGLAAVGGA